MGGRVGGKSHKFYRETRGVKVSGGETVKTGAVLTRQGDRWKPGVNVLGLMKLSAACDGEIYFTRKRVKSGKVATFLNVRAVEKKA
jgi:ribosomal protein L27